MSKYLVASHDNIKRAKKGTSAGGDSESTYKSVIQMRREQRDHK